MRREDCKYYAPKEQRPEEVIISLCADMGKTVTEEQVASHVRTLMNAQAHVRTHLVT